MCYIFIIHLAVAKEPRTNEVAQPTTDLDANLKKALLKALAELENEERTNRNNTQTIQHDSRIFEKASASAVNFIAGPSTTTTTTTTTPAPTEYPVIVQKSDSVQQHTIFSVEPTRDDKEQIQTSASNSFTSSFIEKERNKRPVNPTTTTTTLPPPTTEENEAKVEDVQFFSAPLVAAFTVHQDEQGLPRSVVPIYKPNDFLATTTTVKNQQETITPPPQNKLQFDYLSYQEQQRVLAEQISKLQKQQELYKEYLSKQQQLYQNLQAVPSTNQPFLSGNSVVVQPSYTLAPHHVPTTSFPPNGQQLPIKNAVDFNKNNYFLPLRYNTLVQPPAEVHPVHVSTLSPLPSHTRIFRQELHTGNFLNTPQPVHYQPFRGNFRNVATSQFAFQPPLVNQRLNDLLYRSGIGIGRQQEDLNIVSKVLALNRLRRQGFVNSEDTSSFLQ